MKKFHYMAKINSYIFFFCRNLRDRKNLCDHAEKMTLWVILCAGFISRGGENCGVIAEGKREAGSAPCSPLLNRASASHLILVM